MYKAKSVNSPPRKYKKLVEPENVPNGPWLPLNENSFNNALKRGELFKKVHRGLVDSESICQRCGGLSEHFFISNPSWYKKENTILCLCKNNFVTIDKNREISLKLVQFIGEIKYQLNNGRMPHYWPKIDISQSNKDKPNTIFHTLGKSAFVPFKHNSLKHVARIYERLLIEKLLG